MKCELTAFITNSKTDDDSKCRIDMLATITTERYANQVLNLPVTKEVFTESTKPNKKLKITVEVVDL